MGRLEQAKGRYLARVRRELDKPDETGFLGVLDDGTWPGTADADGYIYEIPYRPGYWYARVVAGASWEVAEVRQGPVRKSPNRLIDFRRDGAALTAAKVNAESATSGSGDDAAGDSVGDHHQPADTVDYTPTAPLTATEVQGALDEIAALIAPDAIVADIDARLLELVLEGRRLTRMTALGAAGGRPKPPVVLALLRWPYGARR